MHGPAEAHTAQLPWGMAAKPDKAQRTIRISMLDSMRFVPDRIEVKRGETVRFLISNDGGLLHEFVLGTKAGLEEHVQRMARHPTMHHEADHMVHVQPGKTGEIVWTFSHPGEFHYACLIAGHYQAGMVGALLVK